MLAAVIGAASGDDKGHAQQSDENEQQNLRHVYAATVFSSSLFSQKNLKTGKTNVVYGHLWEGKIFFSIKS